MSTLNLVLDTLHNLNRWVILVVGLIVIVRGFTGWFGKRRFNAADNRYGTIFTAVLGIQFLLGAILYFTKGWSTVIASGFATAMKNETLRFFTVEHVVMMIVAIGVANMARSLSRKASTDKAKHQRAAIGYLLSIIIILAAIPWPGAPYGRPLLRLFGLSI